MPHFGVYAARITLADGTKHEGVANLGVKPTFGQHAPILETHLFDFSGDFYGQHICVELVEYLRAEQKFDGIDALKAQIAADSERARAILLQEGAAS